MASARAASCRFQQQTVTTDKRMKSRITAALAICLQGVLAAFASPADSVPSRGWTDESVLALNVEARLDGQIVTNSGTTNDAQTGFMGKYLALNARGTITEGLRYSWRQRFSRTPKDATFWDQTDILDLSYSTGKFDFGAGKQVVLIGGYEYNRAPIELMCPNLFVSNVACYQFGISAGYQLTPSDHLAFQVSQSLFATAANRNLYAYNLQWSSHRDFGDYLRFETIWSVNEIEYQKGKYCNYVALGNKLVIDEDITVLLDLMTRTYPDNRAFKNNTFMLEGSWEFHPKWRATAKVSYDCNMGVNTTKQTEVARGSELTTLGGVMEWYPIRKKRHLLKAHAAIFYSFGKNKNKADLMQKNTLYASLGLTWQMNLLNLRR